MVPGRWKASRAISSTLTIQAIFSRIIIGKAPGLRFAAGDSSGRARRGEVAGKHTASGQVGSAANTARTALHPPGTSAVSQSRPYYFLLLSAGQSHSGENGASSG